MIAIATFGRGEISRGKNQVKTDNYDRNLSLLTSKGNQMVCYAKPNVAIFNIATFTQFNPYSFYLILVHSIQFL